jgi:hypothetical protein
MKHQPGIAALLALVHLFAAPLALRSIALQERRGASPDAAVCRSAGKLVPNPDLPEGSGIAASRRDPGLLWAHNDSAKPELVKLDEDGSTVGRVRITGAEVDDWEDIAVGPCAQPSCIYIADIGDNDGRRRHITVYRVAEPARDEADTSPAEAFSASYPDGRHDAESLFVSETGDIYIVTKGDPGPVALYRFPRPLRTGAVMRLERVGQPLSTGNVQSADRPTAADASPDGEWVAVRTTGRVAFYRTGDLTTGRWREAFRFDLSGLREPRGEGIAFGRNGVLFLLGEGGRASRQGTFAKLSCSLR